MKNVINTENSEYIQVHCPDDFTGRPVSGGPESPTQRLCNLIEILLKPLVLVPTLNKYIKDDWDFLPKITTMIPFNWTMNSRDIPSLYTSIPSELAIEAVSYWLHRK